MAVLVAGEAVDYLVERAVATASDDQLAAFLRGAAFLTRISTCRPHPPFRPRIPAGH